MTLRAKKLLHLLWFGFFCSQTDDDDDRQGEEGQHGRKVQVVDVFQHPRPVVLLIAEGRRVDKVQQHADAAHRQADDKAPEGSLMERQDTYHHQLLSGILNAQIVTLISGHKLSLSNRE